MFSLSINSADSFPSSSLPAVSVPFCFISLLHLCNEKTLALKVPGNGGGGLQSANLVQDEKVAKMLAEQGGMGTLPAGMYIYTVYTMSIH